MDNDTKKIIMSAILVVVALIMLPIVITSTTDVMGTANLADYTGAGSIVKLIPLLFIVVVVFGAVWLGWAGVKGKMGKK